MSKITEVPVWEPTVYQADTNKPNRAGPAVFDVNGEATDGFLNAGVQQVTNRTAYLKETLDSHIGSRGAAHTNATQTEAGFMSATDKTKLNGVETGAQVNVSTNLSASYSSTSVNVLSSTGTTAALNSATTSLAGVFSAADKTKLNGVETGAQVNTVTSVATKTGAVTLVKADVGLANVDNTADTAKPVSTAQQTALNLKADLASPALTGVPTAPTAAPGTNNTQLATTAFVLANLASGSAQYMQVQDQKANGVDSGTPTATTWTNRVLTTVVTNQISGASLATNTVTLPAGTYYVECDSPFRSTGGMRIRVWNNSDSTALIISGSGYTNNASETSRAVLSGQFTLAATKNINIQYYVSTANTSGLGLASTTSGVVEIYTNLNIWRVS